MLTGCECYYNNACMQNINKDDTLETKINKFKSNCATPNEYCNKCTQIGMVIYVINLEIR